MKNRVLIKKADYDRYGIILPFRIIRKRQMKNFIRNELEKMHPCFAGSCCIDVKYFFKGKNFFADVVVMEKLGLAGYRKKFPGKKLFLEEIPERKVFGKNNFWKIGVFGILGICLFALMSLRQMEEPVVVKTDTTMASVEAPGKLLGTVLSAVEKSNGKVRALKIRDGECSFELVDCYPENVVSNQYCTVSFLDGRPEFKLVLRNSFQKKKGYLVGGMTDSTVDFVKKLRSELGGYGVLMQLENFKDKNGEICFKCKRDSLKKILNGLAELSENCNWIQNMVEIDCSGELVLFRAGFAAGDGFSRNEMNASLLGTIGLYSDVFLRKERKEQSYLKLNPRKNSSVLSVPQREKIGEIRTDNGTVRIFYKENDGRTVWEDKQISG